MEPWSEWTGLYGWAQDGQAKRDYEYDSTTLFSRLDTTASSPGNEKHLIYDDAWDHFGHRPPSSSSSQIATTTTAHVTAIDRVLRITSVQDISSKRCRLKLCILLYCTFTCQVKQNKITRFLHVKSSRAKKKKSQCPCHKFVESLAAPVYIEVIHRNSLRGPSQT